MELLSQFAVLTPVVLGIVEAIKRVGMDTRYAPIVSVVLGAAGAYYFFSPDMAGVFQGIMAGLMSCGLWSAVRTTANV